MTDRELLIASNMLFDDDPELPEDDRWVNGRLMLNLNDAFFWACADTEEITPEEIPSVARLFRMYGTCGLYYWAVTKRGWTEDWRHQNRPDDTPRWCEFKDIHRMIEFVSREEALIVSEPDGNKRAYKDLP